MSWLWYGGEPVIDCYLDSGGSIWGVGGISTVNLKMYLDSNADSYGAQGDFLL